ncbi:hypothetical protein MASR1M60_18010 [Rhodocyclaceae bacterium]
MKYAIRKMALLLISAGMLSQNVNAQMVSGSGIPVYDGAAVLKIVAQLTQMGLDYEQFQAQTKALTMKLTALKNIDTAAGMQSAADAGLQVLQQIQAGFAPGSDFATQLQAARQAVASAAAAHQAQQAQLGTEARRLTELVNQSQSATGTLEAQQAGNQIILELTQQLQALRAQQLSQAQAQNAEMAAAQRAREEDAAVAKNS